MRELKRGIYDQTGFDVRFEWGMWGLQAAGEGAEVVVIVDVLSFSTAVEVCNSRGGIAYPIAWKDERAVALAEQLGAELAVLRSEMNERRPFSLSPTSLRALAPGTKIVLPSPNGATLSIAAAERRATVLAGCLRNATAVARAAQQRGGTTLVIASGERWPDGSLRPALEDLLGAGAILSALGRGSFSPEAEVAASQFDPARVARLVGACESGRELTDGGYEQDVVFSSEYDASAGVPILVDGAYRAIG